MGKGDAPCWCRWHRPKPWGVSMASPQRIAANRRNARRSTGPRTAIGKARAKRNAWQHGLAARLPCTEAVGSDVERLALAIAGPDPDPCRLHFANIAANAELELRRIHAVRLSLLAARPPGRLHPTPNMNFASRRPRFSISPAWIATSTVCCRAAIAPCSFSDIDRIDFAIP